MLDDDCFEVRSNCRVALWSIAIISLAIACGCIGHWVFVRDYNATLRPGICNITNSYVVERLCAGEDSNWTCYKSCVFVSVFTNDNVMIAEDEEILYGYQGSRSEQVVLDWVHDNAANGTEIQCFYRVDANNEYTGRLQVEYYSESQAFVASMVFFGFAGPTLIVCGFLEVLWCCHRSKRQQEN